MVPRDSSAGCRYDGSAGVVGWRTHTGTHYRGTTCSVLRHSSMLPKKIGTRYARCVSTSRSWGYFVGLRVQVLPKSVPWGDLFVRSLTKRGV